MAQEDYKQKLLSVTSGQLAFATHKCACAETDLLKAVKINSRTSVMRHRVVWYKGIKCFAEACCLRLQDNTASRTGEENYDFRYSRILCTSGR
jgi:hypothetical protein